MGKLKVNKTYMGLLKKAELVTWIDLIDQKIDRRYEKQTKSIWLLADKLGLWWDVDSESWLPKKEFDPITGKRKVIVRKLKVNGKKTK